MVFVAFASLTSWLPQLYKIHQTKSTDDFSLITTAILVWANGSFLAWALYNADVPLAIQQSLTVFMLFLFTYMILKYRTLPVWLRRKISGGKIVNRDYSLSLDIETANLGGFDDLSKHPLSIDIETSNLGDFDDLKSFETACICVYDPLFDKDWVFVDDACYAQKRFLYHLVAPLSDFEKQLQKWWDEGRFLLGHNIEGFDFPVLEHMGVGSVLEDFQIEGRSIDTKKVLLNDFNLRISLQNIVNGTLGDSKSMSGADAPVYWKECRFDDVISYCIKDTRLTYRVWVEGRENGKITVDSLTIPVIW